MFFHQDATFEQLSIHRVGNKAQDELYVLSDEPIDMTQDEGLPDLLLQYFMNPFSKTKEVYRFYHPNEDLQLNEVYYIASQYFDGKIAFHDMSQQLAKHLYEVSEHPKIKAGEVYVVALNNVQLEGEEHQAIGVFKSETKEAYLKVYPNAGGFDLD